MADHKHFDAYVLRVKNTLQRLNVEEKKLLAIDIQGRKKVAWDINAIELYHKNSQALEIVRKSMGEKAWNELLDRNYQIKQAELKQRAWFRYGTG